MDYYAGTMFEEKIKNAGFKLTKPRKLVIKALEEKPHPQSAQSLFRSIGKKIDLASVYRTLWLFESLNLVFKERFGNEELFYIGKEHHHLVCRNCGYSRCIPCDHHFSSIKGFTGIVHNVSLSGICGACSK